MVQDDSRVVVVGTGPAGATAALFLCEAGIDVTLLEAGSWRSALGLTFRVGGHTVAKLRRPLQLRSEGLTCSLDPSARLYEDISPGGLSNHWSCAVPRFSPEDFSDAERAGEAFRWPIGYADLAPWYERVEPLLHIAGASTDRPQLPAGKVSRVWRLGRSWNRVVEEASRDGQSVVPLPYTYGSDTTLTFSGTVFNSFVRLVKRAQRTGRLELRYETRALRLEWSAEQGRVRAVIVRDARTGAEHRIPCRAVVLAAGAVNTARLLLESESDTFPEGLGNTRGVLGRYLHDHPLGKIVVDLDTPLAVHPPAYVTRLPLDRAEPLYATGAVQWTGMGLLARSLLGGRPGRLPWVGFNVFGTMAPTRENRIALDTTRRSADGSSAIELRIRHPPESKALLEAARDRLVELLDRAGFRPRMRLWLIEPAGASVHYAGTCRMHASREFGMLDRWSRLHAVPNVAVADSAAFTTGPEKNPVLTAMALAARAGDRLAHDLRTGAA